MLKIRLARAGRRKAPFFRVVLTEHTKPAKSWYKLVLWRYDPLKHACKVDVDLVKEWIWKGAKPSNRVAKLLKKQTWDSWRDKYIVFSEKTKKTKNETESSNEQQDDTNPEEASPTEDVHQEEDTESKDANQDTD